MTKRMLIDAVHPEETRVVVVDNKNIIDFDFVSSSKKQIKGNIYLAKITRVEPSLQAAFVEYGGGKQGFLPFSEIHADYYQIPAADRKRLLEEAAREAAEEEALESPSDIESLAPTLPENTEEQVLAPIENDVPISLPLLPEIQALPEFPELPELPQETAGAMPLLAGMGEQYEAITSQEICDNAPINENNVNATSPAISEVSESTETSEPAEAVETIPNEEEEMRSDRKKRSFFKRYKIQEVIRRGQIVLVQAIKEERGNKGASLTTYLSLAGRYCVLMPNSPKDGGISRKIASPEDRKRLKAISTELRLAEGMSVIIRTAGMERPRAEIKRDFDYLVKLWNHIRDVTLQSNAPAMIYEESDVIKRAIRDQYSNDMEDIIVQGEAGYEQARDFMKLLLPSHTAKVKLHQDATPLLYAYDIEDQLMSMHDPVVKLKSGGYIVINSTEALIAVDVNSGRSTGERNIEETALKTNLEAAVEVGRQLRLRDLAGLIVIDFIDMLESRNRRAVEKALKDVLKADRAKIQLGRISPFGLLEMSRQRLRPSISETSMVQCPHCEGRGYIRSNESMSIQIIRLLEKEASSGGWGSLRLIAPQIIALHLLNFKRDILQAIEQRYQITIQVLIDTQLTSSEFHLEKMRRANQSERVQDKRRQERSRAVDAQAIATEVAQQPYSDEADVVTSEGMEGQAANSNDESRNRNRRGRRGGRNRRGNNNGPRPYVEPSVAGESVEVASEAVPQESQEANDQPRGDRGNRGPRNRGGRGRRRWRDGEPRPNEAAVNDTSSSSESAAHVTPSNVVDFHERNESSAPIQELPAFTQRAAVTEAQTPAPTVVNLHGSTPSDPNAPSKKGWWQRMINLDD